MIILQKRYAHLHQACLLCGQVATTQKRTRPFEVRAMKPVQRALAKGHQVEEQLEVLRSHAHRPLRTLRMRLGVHAARPSLVGVCTVFGVQTELAVREIQPVRNIDDVPHEPVVELQLHALDVVIGDRVPNPTAASPSAAAGSIRRRSAGAMLHTPYAWHAIYTVNRYPACFNKPLSEAHPFSTRSFATLG
jgi:hypothetical protein